MYLLDISFYTKSLKTEIIGDVLSGDDLFFTPTKAAEHILSTSAVWVYMYIYVEGMKIF